MRIILSLFLLLLAVSGSAQDRITAQEQLQAFGTDLQGLHAEFDQLVSGPDGRQVGDGQGEVWLKTPGLFRWEYLGDFPELIVADGERVWMYDEVLEQVTVREQSGLARNSPLMLLTDSAALEEQFRVAELGQVGGADMLELTSHDLDSEFERIMIGLMEGVPAVMILEDAVGMRTEIRFSSLVRNPELSGDLFRFEPPEGTDIIGDPGLE